VGGRTKRPRLAPGNLGALLEAYLERLRSLRYSAATLACVRSALPGFLFYLERQRVRDARAVSERHVASYALALATAKTRRERILTPNSRRAILSRVRGFFGFLFHPQVPHSLSATH